MLNRKLVARELKKIADILDFYSVNYPLSITASFKQDCLNELKKNRPDLDAEKVSREILKLENIKKQKMALFWICKNSLILPEDQYKLDKAYEILEKTHKDFQRFDGPMYVIDSQDMSIRKQVLKTSFNPDSCRFFSDRYDAGNGVKIYTVEDSKEGQLAVRRAIDSSWELDSNPWCLAARDSNFSKEEFLSLPEEEQDKLDIRLLNNAWRMWNHYSAYPKRIAFKSGKLLAFCASDKLRVQWWDKQDHSSKDIPSDGVKDDSKFIKKFIYDKKKRIKKAEDPNTSPEEFRELAEDEDEDVRKNVAKNPSTPVDALRKLAEDKDKYVRSRVAANPNTTVDILRKLAEDGGYNVRAEVTGNPNTPADVLRKLAEDEYRYVRSSIAYNQKTPADILRDLAEDEDEDVREGTAYNPSTPVDTLRKLAEDEDRVVRWNVASNPSTPVDILRELAEDENRLVREYVAENQNITVDILRELAEDKDKVVRWDVARNPKTPVDALRKLAEDEDKDVRWFVTGNPNTPADVLRKLSRDKNLSVKQHAIKSLNSLQH